MTPTFSGYSTPQVLCSGTGATINSAALVSLGTCTIPPGCYRRATGSRSASIMRTAERGRLFDRDPLGRNHIVHRDALSTETLSTGRADAGVLTSNAQLSSETWGTALAFSANAVVAGDAYANGLTIDFRGLVANGGDTLTLSNFAVVRIP